ncbi:AraC family transcriptional regulator [Flavihumibacter fluvii]|uniref:AraC family transcriptional regulator n=1 Tax=Flavihumibacter fluvii TaxID=2838157 RepID=UPI001BDE8276|nr:AraC family transcriptional regulator [Flavihumibacter fluvii]ULQ50935.1 AraC family transcriptional regulator [Flavihumibacter fluvii]
MKKIPIRQLISPRQEIPSTERFKIRKVQDLLDREDLFHELHRHDFFFIIALQKGAGIHEIDFTPYKVIDNAIFFMRPGQVHQLQLKADSTGYIIEFNTEFYHPKDRVSTQRLRKASNKNYCELETNRFEKLYGILTNIFQEYTDREEGFQDVIKANLDIFFIEYVRQSPNPNGPSTTVNPYTQERLEEFLALLESHITTQKQVSQYTDLMNLSPYQLNEITKATMGKTASELINEHIILEAKRNLLATPNQIKDIADILGYEDVSYFIRFFRKQTGYSPEAFRNNHR